jgi:hypothetical protein
MDDDKGDYRENPVRTHLRMAPSEERVLPERRQVKEGYVQGAGLSNVDMGTLKGFPNPPALWLCRAKPGDANAIEMGT